MKKCFRNHLHSTMQYTLPNTKRSVIKSPEMCRYCVTHLKKNLTVIYRNFIGIVSIKDGGNYSLQLTGITTASTDLRKTEIKKLMRRKLKASIAL